MTGGTPISGNPHMWLKVSLVKYHEKLKVSIWSPSESHFLWLLQNLCHLSILSEVGFFHTSFDHVENLQETNDVPKIMLLSGEHSPLNQSIETWNIKYKGAMFNPCSSYVKYHDLIIIHHY